MHLFYTTFVLWVLSACHMTTSTCDELLSSEDAEFCKGKLKVIYPDLVVDKCMIVPQRIREKISKEWGPPQIQLPSADEEKKYTLLMVDPDAPSRQKPSRAYWRHWLLVDIKISRCFSSDTPTLIPHVPGHLSKSKPAKIQTVSIQLSSQELVSVCNTHLPLLLSISHLQIIQ
ncbi:uncharacterized protein LOC131545827 isoform X3 [Onychostoma macrolepis]|uniref:uncharacterized protein LOC131545827 isoform X3 n=1 Tax=Onychostoma macrolepis TaxID=369639 RepID=UPI00272B5D68|nr:uncharacterized protein LOC131545827 isoform X3 [Onychostoma macrolepis]